MASQLTITGGAKLTGVVRIQGSKNAFHKVLGAIVCTPGVFRIKNVPNIQDATWLQEQFEYVGGKIERNGDVTIFDSRSIEPKTIGSDLATKSSGTFLFAGALLARFGKASIAKPGGDKIGYRPVDFHLQAFQALGATIEEKNGVYDLQGELRPADFTFPKRSVNGTVNAVLAASGASGTTTLRNCALESDIENCFAFLRAIGTRVDVVDSAKGVVHVTPGKALDLLDFALIADRNATATYAIAGALIGEAVTLENVHTLDTQPLWTFLREIGVSVEVDSASARAVCSKGTYQAYKKTIQGRIPPEFSTDWGPLVQVLLTQLPGVTEYHDTVFTNRFALAPELAKMGAKITLHEVESDTWISANQFDQAHKYDRCRIEGPTPLRGVPVVGNDIRQCAALVLAALIAEGETTIAEAIHVQRGYEDIAAALGSLGAHIAWV
jgi:UDP-N-acetylglucosamine 1-carboxyvinyltransferase